MDVCFTVCGSYFASRMTESAGAERLVGMEGRMRSRRQRISGLMGGGHGPSDGDLPELQATSNAYSDCQHRQPRLRPSDRAFVAYADL
jgi:hypothetical protein